MIAGAYFDPGWEPRLQISVLPKSTQHNKPVCNVPMSDSNREVEAKQASNLNVGVQQRGLRKLVISHVVERRSNMVALGLSTAVAVYLDKRS